MYGSGDGGTNKLIEYTTFRVGQLNGTSPCWEKTDAIRDDTLDEAMFRSWNKQKKEYQDEIRRLNNEVSKYQLKLD